jgi:hypothetical protein
MEAKIDKYQQWLVNHGQLPALVGHDGALSQLLLVTSQARRGPVMQQSNLFPISANSESMRIPV